jgi:hypothetical protein
VVHAIAKIVKNVKGDKKLVKKIVRQNFGERGLRMLGRVRK